MGPLIPLAIGGISALAGKLFGGGGSKSTPQSDLQSLLRSIPELRQSLDLQTAQRQRQDPLHAALTQLALNILPKYAYQNFDGRPSVGPTTPSPQPSQPQSPRLGGDLPSNRFL